MVPIFAKRVEREKFEIIIKEPVEYIADEVSSKDEKIQKITQKYTNILEQEILSSPAQWAWEYKRWRKPNKE
jgi:lauroyl/myristoyl acyltransferase